MARVIGKKIRKFPAVYTPDPKWERQGTTPWGAQLYVERRPHGKSVPVLNSKGKQVWVRSENTGQKLYKKRTLERFTFERMFFLFDEGNGNVHKEPYKPPTPEELKAAKESARGEALMEQFKRFLGKSEMSLEQLMSAFMRGPTLEHQYATPEEVAAAAAAGELEEEEDVGVDRPPLPDTVQTFENEAIHRDFDEDELEGETDEDVEERLAARLADEDGPIGPDEEEEL
ncbi:MAG: hypothetical protein AB7Q29_16015 [Vicinamibacterales bacterium]